MFSPETSRRVPLLLLGFIAVSTVAAAHIFIPALPLAASDLKVGAREMQLTVSVYIAGLALGQLIYGPLSDWLGERRVLLAGLCLFVAASAAAGIASSSGELTALRLAQSLGGGAGLVLSRTMARDGSDDKESTKRLALMNLVITLGPALSPLIGGFISTSLGWRYIFAIISLFGLLNLIGVAVYIPERERRRPALSVVLRNYRELVGTPSFIGYALAGACFTTPMYAIIGAAPFILVHKLGYPLEQVGPILASATIGIWLGSITASRLVERMSVAKLLGAGCLCACFSSFLFMGMVIFNVLTTPMFVGVMALFLFGAGLSGPPALSLSLAVNPTAAGSGSGIYGAGQMAVGALCSFAASLAVDPALGAAGTLVAAVSLGVAGLRLGLSTQNQQSVDDKSG